MADNDDLELSDDAMTQMFEIADQADMRRLEIMHTMSGFQMAEYLIATAAISPCGLVKILECPDLAAKVADFKLEGCAVHGDHTTPPTDKLN